MGKKFFKKLLVIGMAATLVIGSAVSASAATSSPASGSDAGTKKAATVTLKKTKGSVANVAKKTITVNYTTKNAKSVKVQYRIAGKKSWSKKSGKTGSGKSVKLSVKNNKLYEIRVSAVGKDGKTKNSKVMRRYIAGTKVTKATPKKKAVALTWKKVSGATGYQIRYSTSKDMKNYKTTTVKKASTVKTTLKNLKAKKTYYIQVRPLKTYKGKTYIGGSLAKKKVTTK